MKKLRMVNKKYIGEEYTAYSEEGPQTHGSQLIDCLEDLCKRNWFLWIWSKGEVFVITVLMKESYVMWSKIWVDAPM